MSKNEINSEDIISEMNIDQYNQPINRGSLPMIQVFYLFLLGHFLYYNGFI